MRWDALAEERCSLARALAVVGERWTMMILREAFLGICRFDSFQANLGIARRVLTERLAQLVADGILDKVVYQERPLRHEYRLTKKGRALYPAILALVHWGDDWYAGADGPPVLHQHTVCGHDFRAELRCSECGKRVTARNVEARIAQPTPAA